MTISSILNSWVNQYPIDPSLKELLIDCCEKTMRRDGYGQKRHVKIRAELLDQFVSHHPNENRDALMSTANDVVAIARNRWEVWCNRGGRELIDGLPESLNEIVAGAYKRIDAEHRCKADKLCSIIRSYLFESIEATNKKAVAIATESAAIVGDSPTSKDEKASIIKMSERLLSSARDIITNAIRFGKSLDLAVYPLDKSTEVLVRYFGEAAKLINEGQTEKLKSELGMNPARFKRWEGSVLIVKILIEGVPNFGTTNIPQMPITSNDNETDGW